MVLQVDKLRARLAQEGNVSRADAKAVVHIEGNETLMILTQGISQKEPQFDLLGKLSHIGLSLGLGRKAPLEVEGFELELGGVVVVGYY